MIEPHNPSVFVMELTAHYKEVVMRLLNRTISFEELFMSALNYWRNGLRSDVMDEDQVWEQVHEAIMGMEEIEWTHLAHRRRQYVPEAVACETDELAALVIEVAEDLDSLLVTLGVGIEGIGHICRGVFDDYALYIFFYPPGTSYIPPMPDLEYWALNHRKIASV